MSDPATAFRAAEDSVLRNSAALATAMGLATPRLYTKVPQNALLPYVVLGQHQILGDDTVCKTASEIFSTIHAYAMDPDVARAIGAALRSALTTNFAITGFEIVEWEFQDANYVTDPDGSTHLIHTQHYFVDPTS